MMARWTERLSLFLACAAIGASGCRGDIGDMKEGMGAEGTPGPGEVGAPGTPGVHPLPPASDACRNAAAQPGASPLRRMNRIEYNNTVRDLLNDATAPASQFPDEEIALGFTNNADAQTVSGLLIEGYESAASALATAATANLPTLLGCDPATKGEDACVRAFLPVFGQKAYRRPLDAGEVDRLFAFYTSSKTSYDFPTAVRLTVQAILELPHFIYRIEASGAQPVTKPSGYEIASRLSYLVWGSMPDAALFDAAAAGKLDTAAGIREQAERMLASPHAKQSVATFFAQWLDLDRVGKVDKDATLFPKFTKDVRGLLRKETEMLFDDAVFGGGGGMKTLLLGNYTFMNKDLAAYYGRTGPAGATFEKVMLDPNRQIGFLTQAGLLAASAKVNQTSPVQRGLFVRDKLLCDAPPPPPANVNATPPIPDPKLSTRDRYAAHRANAACSSCHQLMDPLGSRFRALRWRRPVARHRRQQAGRCNGAGLSYLRYRRTFRRRGRPREQAEHERRRRVLHGQTVVPLRLRTKRGGRRSVHPRGAQQGLPLWRLQGADLGADPDRRVSLSFQRARSLPMSGSQLSRRAALRGAGGILVGLPALEAMTPRTARAATTAPKRLVIFYSPNGTDSQITEPYFWPQQTGPNFVLGKEVSPLEPLRKNLLIVSGVNGESMKQDDSTVNPKAAGHGDLHSIGMSQMLTGVSYVFDQSTGIIAGALPGGYAGGISVDQYIAKKLAPPTRFPTLEFGVINATDAGILPFSRMISAGRNQPIPAEQDPAKMFTRIFTSGAPAMGQMTVDQSVAQRKSVLDFVLAESGRLQQRLGAADRQKLDDHLTQVRTLEARLKPLSTPVVTQASCNSIPAVQNAGDPARQRELPSDRKAPHGSPLRWR